MPEPGRLGGEHLGRGDRHRHRRRAVGEVVAPVGEHRAGEVALAVAVGVRAVARLAVDHLAAHVEHAHPVEVVRAATRRKRAGRSTPRMVQSSSAPWTSSSRPTRSAPTTRPGSPPAGSAASCRRPAASRRGCSASGGAATRSTLVLVSDLARAVETAQIAFVGSGLRRPPRPPPARVRLRRVERHAGRAAGGANAPRTSTSLSPAARATATCADQMEPLLAELREGRHGRRVLLIGHSATRWALDHLIDGRAARAAGRRAVRLASGLGVRMGVTDRYWRPIEPGEAERVLGRPVEIVSAHLRWLFAVAHCRWEGGEAIVKRQPPMGRDRRAAALAAPADQPPGRPPAMPAVRVRRHGRAGRALVRDRRRRPRRGRRLRRRRHVGAVPLRRPRRARRARCWPACTTPRRDFEPAAAAAAGRLRGAARPACGWSRRTPSPSWRPPRPGGRPTTWTAARLARAPVDRGLRRRVRPASRRCCPSCRARPLHGDWQTNNLFFDGRPDQRHHRLPPGRPRAAAARPGDRGRAQLLLLEPRSRKARTTPTTSPRRACWSGRTTRLRPLSPARAGGLRRRARLLPVRVRHLVPRLLLGRRARPREGRLGVAHVRARPRRSGGNGRRPRGPGPGSSASSTRYRLSARVPRATVRRPDPPTAMNS